jgi:hypothetical protein
MRPAFAGGGVSPSRNEKADRDRLVTLKKAKKKLITQREAAEELGVSTRHIKRLLHASKKRGDKGVIHGLRGKPSNRRIP